MALKLYLVELGNMAWRFRIYAIAESASEAVAIGTAAYVNRPLDDYDKRNPEEVKYMPPSTRVELIWDRVPMTIKEVFVLEMARKSAEVEAQNAATVAKPMGEWTHE